MTGGRRAEAESEQEDGRDETFDEQLMDRMVDCINRGERCT